MKEKALYLCNGERLNWKIIFNNSMKIKTDKII